MGIFGKIKRLFHGGSHHSQPQVNAGITPPAHLPPEAARLQNAVPTQMFERDRSERPPEMEPIGGRSYRMSSGSAFAPPRPVARQFAMPPINVAPRTHDELARDFAERSAYGNSVLPGLLQYSGYDPSQLENSSRLAYMAYGKSAEEMLQIIRASALAKKSKTGISEAEYKYVRDTLAPFLQKFENFDADGISQLSDKKMFQRLGDIDDVMMPHMHISDMMRGTMKPGENISMLEDLYGKVGTKRRDEFARKSALIRGLHDYARGTLLQEAEKKNRKLNGPAANLSRDYFNEYENHNKLHGAATEFGDAEKEYIESRITLGKNAIKNSRRKKK